MVTKEMLQVSETNIVPENKKRAFVVVGFEGSGTTMLTEALVAAGCHWEQRHETEAEIYSFATLKEDKIVIHRSVPHAGRPPDINRMLEELNRAGFVVDILWIFREMNAQVSSVLRRDPQRIRYFVERDNVSGIAHISDSLSSPFLAGFELTTITYSAFCLSEGFRRWLFTERLGLLYPEDFEIKYTNSQYYEEKDR